ncbi:hypothetical protein [Janibacter sp. G56]|uniref:hypothetical protein n=1 Tax=Janibacter sp. G56 TaxID=3418717 RepID=UPI003D06E8CC
MHTLLLALGFVNLSAGRAIVALDRARTSTWGQDRFDVGSTSGANGYTDHLWNPANGDA